MSTPNSKIKFSQVREDPLIELYCCRLIRQARDRLLTNSQHLPSGLTVLLIGSGGETALSLLSLECVDHIDVVDMNPDQILLIQLRLLMIKYEFPIQNQLQLLGLSWIPCSGEQRWKLFLDFCQKVKDPEDQKLLENWKSRQAEIEFGVGRVGRYEELFRELASHFEKLGLQNPVLNYPF